jgi:hypothetical protein
MKNGGSFHGELLNNQMLVYIGGFCDDIKTEFGPESLFRGAQDSEVSLVKHE